MWRLFSRGCDGMSIGRRSFGRCRPMGMRRMMCGRSGWGEVEALLWWGPETVTPPLVATGNQFQFPSNVVLGGPDSAIGGTDLTPGLRANFGFWLDANQTVGAGGRVFGLFPDDVSHEFESDGVTTLGVPRLDIDGVPNLPLESALIVAQDSQNSGRDPGAIRVDHDMDFIAAEAYGKLLMARTGCSRADLIGGYSFLRLDDSLSLYTRSVQNITNLVPDGTVRETFDRFSAANSFHGGHVGFTTDITRGRWTLSTLGKVAMGNMHQRLILEARPSSPLRLTHPLSLRKTTARWRSPATAAIRNATCSPSSPKPVPSCDSV